MQLSGSVHCVATTQASVSSRAQLGLSSAQQNAAAFPCAAQSLASSQVVNLLLSAEQSWSVGLQSVEVTAVSVTAKQHFSPIALQVELPHWIRPVSAPPEPAAPLAPLAPPDPPSLRVFVELELHESNVKMSDTQAKPRIPPF